MRIRKRWGVIIGCAAAFSLLGCDGGDESAESGGSDVVGTESSVEGLPTEGTACDTPGDAHCADSSGGVICKGTTWKSFSAGQQGEGNDCWDEYYCEDMGEGVQFSKTSICIGFAGISVAGQDRTVHRTLRSV